MVTRAQDGLIKQPCEENSSRFVLACPLGRRNTFHNRFKDLCSHPKFTKKLQIITVAAELLLSLCRFSSVESMASSGYRLKRSVSTVILATDQTAGSRTWGLLPFHKGSLPIPNRRNKPPTDSLLYPTRGKSLCPLKKKQNPRILTKFNTLQKPSYHG